MVYIWLQVLEAFWSTVLKERKEPTVAISAQLLEPPGPTIDLDQLINEALKGATLSFRLRLVGCPRGEPNQRVIRRLEVNASIDDNGVDRQFWVLLFRQLYDWCKSQDVAGDEQLAISVSDLTLHSAGSDKPGITVKAQHLDCLLCRVRSMLRTNNIVHQQQWWLEHGPRTGRHAVQSA